MKALLTKPVFGKKNDKWTYSEITLVSFFPPGFNPVKKKTTRKTPTF